MFWFRKEVLPFPYPVWNLKKGQRYDIGVRYPFLSAPPAPSKVMNFTFCGKISLKFKEM